MSARRALVDCAVLSLQDACVFYPCCKGCFSRIDVEQREATRCRCYKCGYSCLREQVDYRYRLSLRVTRDGCIFGVTVFGSCLNPFFGIHASGLQRLVENLDGPVGPATRSTLLMKAVADCFIGRHFIFGLKVTETQSGPWFGGPVANGSRSKDTVHFIAYQMILPKAAGLGGCTVVSYYRILLQKAAEYELGSADSRKTSRPPAATLLLIPRHSPASSFSNDTLCASGLFPLLQRSQYQDCTLSPTPPWQQSLGLVTSSAEQEEGCSTQDSCNENSRQTDFNFKTPHHAQRGCLVDQMVTEETEQSLLLPLECSSYSCPSFAKYSHSAIEKAVGNIPIMNNWLSPSPGHNSSKAKGFSTRQPTETSLPSSLVWEDLPFSESLTEFLCKANKDFDIVCETEPRLNVKNQKETTRDNPEIRSQDRNISIQSTSVCQSNTQMTDRHSRILQNITNTPAANGGDKHDLSDQVCRNPSGCVNKSEARNIYSHKSNQDEKDSLLSFENDEEEHFEGDTYNCSADLFSSSPVVDMNRNTFSTHAESVGTTPKACPVLFKSDKWHPRSETANVSYSTPDEQKLETNTCINRDGLISPGTQDLNFIPPSQSTPIVKVAVVSGSYASSYRTMTLGEFSSQPDTQDSCAFDRNLPELVSKKPAKITPSLCKLNSVRANLLSRCGRESTKESVVCSTRSSRHSHTFTPKRRFWKPDKHKHHLMTQQHLRGQRGVLNTGSIGRINHRCDSSDSDVTVCDYEDSDTVLVPPTPAANTRLSVLAAGRRRRQQTDDSSGSVDYTWEGKQRDGVDCKRTLLPQTVTSSQRGQAQRGNCDSGTIDDGSLDGSNCYLLDDENQACDWSRDLFSDSV
ncbi:DNA damage-induced apoptosis suppressor protein isoform X2 [Dicentrarchus labrax]|uniref:DNA damage-induced apoptosis suppressor protein isoform X2 n=1 Tax=Dicentrarchus labrax TaxID=13489 RepID=UPI001632D010|nr:DNA damage-induced apoptosis suppressor protein isoform X2 [Dicentrarchus labrax]